MGRRSGRSGKLHRGTASVTSREVGRRAWGKGFHAEALTVQRLPGLAWDCEKA